MSNRFASVWDALEDTSTAAAHVRLQADIMVALQEVVARLPEPIATARLGLAPDRLDDLRHGRLSCFDLDSLVGLAERAGLIIQVRPAAE